MVIQCKPWRLRNRGLFTKADFELDLEAQTARCPAGEQVALSNAGRSAHFGERCGSCALRAQCTRAKAGRSINIHSNEPLHMKLREADRDPVRRRARRQRTQVEHGLARLGQIQGRRARYRGARRNTYGARVAATVANLHVLSGFSAQSPDGWWLAV